RPHGENNIDAPPFTMFHAIAHVELPVFEKRDEAASKAEKISSADDEGLQGMLEISARAELERNLKQLMQLLCLTLRGGRKFGVRHGDRAKASNRRQQRFLLRREGPFFTRINKNRPLRARGAKGSGNHGSGRHQAAERVLVVTHRDRDDFSGGNRPLREIGGEANGLAVMRSPE